MKKLLLMFFLFLSVHCADFKDFDLKVVWSNSFMGSKSIASSTIRNDVASGLSYVSNLGYSHIIHYMDGPNEFGHNFIKTRSGWEYNRTNYTGGEHYTQLAAIKSLAENRGMKVIPSIPGISWVGYFIGRDNSIAEDIDDVDGGVGWAYLDEDGKNEAMDQFAELYGQIICAAWGNTMPEYVFLGYDELKGFNVPGGKTDLNNHAGLTSSQLVVKSIINRMKLVDDLTDGTFDGIVNSSSGGHRNTKFLLWGDSFVEGDNGELLGLTGDDGILALLKQHHRSYFDRMIIMPWRYGVVDGTIDIGGMPDKYDKKKVLNYLNKEIGVKYIFLGGEGANYTSPSWPNEDGNVICLTEWLQAATNNSENWVGVGISSWVDNANWSGHQTTPASWEGVLPPLWTAPVLSYLAFENNSKLPELANLSNGIYPQRLKRFINWESCRMNNNYIFSPLRITDIKRPSCSGLFPLD